MDCEDEKALEHLMPTSCDPVTRLQFDENDGDIEYCLSSAPALLYPTLGEGATGEAREPMIS